MNQTVPASASAVLPARRYWQLLLLVWGLYLSFSYSTDLADLALSSARDPQRWAHWRYAVVTLWLLLAAALFWARGRRVSYRSLRSAGIVAGLVAAALASLWAGMAGHSWIYLSALFYAAIAALLAANLHHPALAALLAALLVPLQVIVDLLVLGAAGGFRIH